MSDLTHVELVWLEKRIENRIRFGRVAAETIIDRGRRIVVFSPGSIFAFVRWAANDFGTVVSRIDILRAVSPGERCSTVPYVRPGGDILLRLSGWTRVERALQAIDAVEALGIHPADAAPDHWRHVSNRLSVAEQPRPYTHGRHRAWLILDNCHVRVSFATNDERTAKRVSDALGTATEIRDSRNYAGHRLSPWLGHLMVSRLETARPLLTPGEVMQLPATDELVLVSGIHPVRAKKARYYEDRRLKGRIISPPMLTGSGRPTGDADDWNALPPPVLDDLPAGSVMTPADSDDTASGGIRREPALPIHEAITPATAAPEREFAILDDEPDDDVANARAIRRGARVLARQVAMDPADGIEL